MQNFSSLYYREIKLEGRENKGNDRQLGALDYQANSPRSNLEECMENSLE